MAEIKAGQYITDGTSVFILDDVRDGNRVGDIVFRPVLHDGYIKANGATVTASEYPRLLKFAQDNNLLVDSSAWDSDKSKYVYDSGAGTLKIPDAQGRVLQGTANTVKSVEAGLPNISGILAAAGVASWQPGSGAFSFSGDLVGIPALKSPVTEKHESIVNFNAQKSNSIYGNSSTVQSPALALIPQIKY